MRGGLAAPIISSQDLGCNASCSCTCQDEVFYRLTTVELSYHNNSNSGLSLPFSKKAGRVTGNPIALECHE